MLVNPAKTITKATSNYVGDDEGLLVGSGQVIKRGSLVQLLADGTVGSASTSQTGIVIGSWDGTTPGSNLNIAEATANTSIVVTKFPTLLRHDGTLTNARVGDTVFLVDNNTVTKTANYHPVGTLTGFSGSLGCWIEFNISQNTVFQQPRWNDLQGSLTTASGLAALVNQGWRDTGHLLYFSRHDQDDLLCFQFQFPHTWNPGTEIRYHAHIAPTGTVTGNSYWTVKYTFANFGDVIPANAGWTTSPTTFQILGTEQYKHIVVPLLTVTPPAGSVESTLLLVNLVRAGTNVADTYSSSSGFGTAQANICLLYTDVHYQVQKTGTVTEF